MAEDPPRVCVTGVGAVSPYGRSAGDLWAGLSAGRNAVAPITSFDASALQCRIAGEVRDYAPRDDMDKDAAAAMDRRSLFAADAAIQALIDADVPINAESVAQIGVSVGCEVAPAWMTTAMDVARTISAAGPVLHVSNAAVSGLTAIGEAAEWIRRQDCSIAVAGGAEAPITPDVFAHFMTMLTKRNGAPDDAVRPYGEGRDGFALSEGAAMLVLEDESVAIRRGAHILAYLDGYGATFSRSPVAHPAPNPLDAGRAMQAALMKWDLTLQAEIDVIFGCAGGGAIDAVEGQAIRRVWGPNADKLWVTAIKGSLGHTLGASGALAAVTAIFALQAGLIPPTRNADPRDAECSGLEIVQGGVRRLSGARAMVNAFGLGHNASIIVSRP
jgi:3-oxoacyl-[acyl-carrier-protein] synthase II